MEKLFNTLKEHHGTHKAAAKALSVSYVRYNEWRWDPDKMPERARVFVRMAAENLRVIQDQ